MKTRRELLKRSARVASLLVVTGLLPAITHAQGAAYSADAFGAKHLPELMAVLGVSAPVESSEVTLEAPDIAPSSAFVLLGAATALTGVQRLLLLVEKNPNLMSAMFELSDAVEPSVMLRVKMRESSNVLAVALMRDGRVLYAQKHVEIAQGGCDG